MADAFQFIGGLILISITFVFMLTFQPNLLEGTNTHIGHTQENATGNEKLSYDMSYYILSFLPFIVFFIGLGLLLVGVLQ